MSTNQKKIAISVMLIGLAVIFLIIYFQRSKIIEEWYIFKLESGSVEEFTDAARNLELMQSEKAIPILVQKLNEANYRVRSEASTLLCKYGSKAEGEVKNLIKLLNVGNSEIKKMTADVLGSIGPSAQESLPLLVNLANNDDCHYTRSAAVRAIGEIGTNNEEIISEVIRVLKEDIEPYVRMEAAQALGKFDKNLDNIIISLNIAMNDDFQGVKVFSIRSLSKLGSRSKLSMENLINAICNDNNDVQYEAIKTVGEIGRDAYVAIPTLFKIINDKNENVKIKNMARESLMKINQGGPR